MKSCFLIKKVIYKICLYAICTAFISSCTIFKNNFPSSYAFFNNSLGFDEEFDTKDLEKIKKKQQEEGKKKIIKNKEEKKEPKKTANTDNINTLKKEPNNNSDKNKIININNKVKEKINVGKEKKDNIKEQNNQNKKIEKKKDNVIGEKGTHDNIYYKSPTENQTKITQKQINNKENTIKKTNDIVENEQTSTKQNKRQENKSNNTFTHRTNKKDNYKHFGIVISGPSGVGKTTIVNELIKRNHNVVSSISATTRQKRNNEKDGVDYYFITNDKFKELALNNEFLEYSTNYDNNYGTPKRNYFDTIDEGKDIIFTLNLDGMLNIKNNTNLDIVSIYILPSTFEELKKRLIGRKTETKEQMEKRLKSAQNEINRANGLYDYIVYNYDLENAITTINAIYLAEQRKREIID